MPVKDQYLIREFKRILKRNAGEVYVNLDDKFTEQFNFFVQTAEAVLKETGNSIAPNRWSYHRLLLITEGAADYICGIYKFRAVKNSLVIIPARAITCSEWLPGTKGFITLFNADFLIQHHFSPKFLEEKSLLLPSGQPFLHLRDEEGQQVTEIFKAMLRENNAEGSNSGQLVAVKLAELVLLAERIYADSQEAPAQQHSFDLVKRFAASVEAHFMNEKAVSYYASLLHVHPNHLNAVVKAHTGFTAKESIQNRLLLEAKYLLLHTNLSIKEIAHQLGFADPDYFGAFFKRAEQRSPVAYRSSFT